MRCTLSWDVRSRSIANIRMRIHNLLGRERERKRKTAGNGLGGYDFAKQFAILLMPSAGFAKSLLHFECVFMCICLFCR